MIADMARLLDFISDISHLRTPMPDLIAAIQTRTSAARLTAPGPTPAHLEVILEAVMPVDGTFRLTPVS